MIKGMQVQSPNRVNIFIPSQRVTPRYEVKRNRKVRKLLKSYFLKKKILRVIAAIASFVVSTVVCFAVMIGLAILAGDKSLLGFFIGVFGAVWLVYGNLLVLSSFTGQLKFKHRNKTYFEY